MNEGIEYNVKQVEKIDEDELEKEIDELYSEVDEITDSDFETNIRVESKVKISKKEIPDIKPNVSGKKKIRIKK